MKATFVCALLLALLAAVATAAPLVPVQTYVMSKCPYCRIWADSYQKQVMGAKGVPQIVSLSLVHVGKIVDGNFVCLHGPTECAGDIIQLCAFNLTNPSPNNYKWWDMTLCMDDDQANIPDNGQRCAQKAGLDWKPIADCANGPLGKQLFTDSILYAQSKGIHSTPTVFINGKQYNGDNFLGKICDAYEGVPPPGCN